MLEKASGLFFCQSTFFRFPSWRGYFGKLKVFAFSGRLASVLLKQKKGNMTALDLLKNSPELKDFANEIVSDPDIMDGLPIFAGTRVPVYIILDYLAEGFTLPEIKKDFPTIDDKKIKVALKFAGLLSTLH